MSKTGKVCPSGSTFTVLTVPYVPKKRNPPDLQN